MRKLIFIILAALLLATNVKAQTPSKLSYQAVIRDVDGKLVVSKAVGFRISILQGSANGVAVYTETQTPISNTNGLVSIEVGGGTVLSGSITSINWATGLYFIKTETDPSGGANYSIVGTSQLLAVPYALYAEKAGNGFSGNYNDLNNKPTTVAGYGITDAFNGTWTNLTGKPSTIAGYGITNAFDGQYSSLTGKPSFATVATSGNYNDLTNKPAGNVIGDMQYWNGTAWAIVPVGQPGQFLQLTTTNIPAWSGAAYPTLTTTAISSITSTSAATGGNIITDGGGVVTSRGICWNTSANPTIANTKNGNGSGTGVFTSSITGLIIGITYYVRAYAINSAGVVYGNEVSFTTAVGIGESYQGGIVAYILQSGDPGYIAGERHGLIAAPSDQGSGKWYNVTTTTVGVTSTALGTGNANTNIIVTNQGAGSYAAQMCNDLVLGGYSDWYLPSKDELSKLYNNRIAIGGFVSGGTYWSSSEDAIYYAWVQYFNSTFYQTTIGKVDGPCYVRAIRSF